jgi:hypothetical protein
MKKSLGLLLLAIVGLVGSASAVLAPPNVYLDVQTSTNTLPGALIIGRVAAQGSTFFAQGTTNNLGRVSLPYRIYGSTAVIPASYVVNGLGTDGFRILTGSANGNFNVITSTFQTRVPVFLPMR